MPKLRCRAIVGAANNQLTEESVAELLAARGILWAPDFVVNAGGVINLAVELRPEGYDAAVARRQARAIGDTLAQVLDAADTRPASPRSRPPTRWRSAGWRTAATAAVAALERGSRQPLRGRSTPSGSRPSSASLSRWAASVTVAAGRRIAGASDQAASSSSSTVRAPRGERGEQRRSRAQAVLDVLVDLRVRVLDERAVAGADQRERHARAGAPARRDSRRARPGRAR